MVYGAAFVLSRAASFIMLPVYTNYLRPEDYATLYLLQMSLDVATILLSSGVTAGVSRFYFKGDDERTRRAVVVAAWVMNLLLNAVGALLLVLSAPALATHLLDDASRTTLVWIIAASFVLDPCVTVPMLFMEVQQRSLLYSMTCLARLGLQLGLNLLFVIGFDLGVGGIVASTLITYLVLVPPCLFWMLRRTGLVWSRPAFADLWRFGWPYRVTEAGTFTLTYVDRYFLVAAWGLAATGVYSLAYQFGFLVAYLGFVPFFLAWNPQRFQIARQPRAERDRLYNQGFRWLSVLVVTLAVGISLLVHPVLQWIAGPAYHGAAALVPWIVAAYVLQAWTQVLELGIQVSEKTHFATIATWVAVAAVLVLYALLIPPYGPLGAALATVIAFAVRLVAFWWAAQRLWPVSYEWRPHALLAAYAVAVVLAHAALRPWMPELPLALGLIAVWFGLVLGGGVLPPEDRLLLGEAIRRLPLGLRRGERRA